MYIFVWFALTSVFWRRTASLLITVACDMSEGGQSVMLSASGLFIDCSRQGPMMAHHFSLGSLACRWQKSMISHIWQLSALWLTISPSIISSSISPSCHFNYIKPYSRNASLHRVPESIRLSANPCASHILSASGPGCVFTLLSSGSTVLARCQRQIIPDFPLWGETVSLWLTTA